MANSNHFPIWRGKEIRSFRHPPIVIGLFVVFLYSIIFFSLYALRRGIWEWKNVIEEYTNSIVEGLHATLYIKAWLYMGRWGGGWLSTQKWHGPKKSTPMHHFGTQPQGRKITSSLFFGLRPKIIPFWASQLEKHGLFCQKDQKIFSASSWTSNLDGS